MIAKGKEKVYWKMTSKMLHSVAVYKKGKNGKTRDYDPFTAAYAALEAVMILGTGEFDLLPFVLYEFRNL